MRILFDATPLQTGHRQRGVGTYARELLRALLDHSEDVQYRLIVHRPRQGDAAGQLARDLGLARLPANVDVVVLPRPALGRFTGFVTHQALLPALLARERADLFHAPGFVAAFSVPGLPWRCPLPLVATLHDFIPLHVPALFNDKAINRWWYGRQLARAARAEHLICVSQATRQDALRFLQVPEARCTVVHEGVDGLAFYPRPSGELQPSPPYILFVGGDYPNKNRPAALAAFARLVQASDLPHHLVMVGPDQTSDHSLGQRYPGLDVDRVRRLPAVSQAELLQLYQRADLLLFPSTCEGFGLPVLEAMACGTPVVTSRASSLPEVAGDAALLVDPHDVEAIAAAVGRILADEDLKMRLRQAGLRRAASFTWEATAQQTLSVYREVVRSR